MGDGFICTTILFSNTKQEGIPVGCIPPAHWTWWKGGQGVPRDLPHHVFDVTYMLPPHQLRPTNSAAAYILLVGHVTCKACWDTPPPWNRILNTRFWKYYLAPTSLRAVIISVPISVTGWISLRVNSPSVLWKSTCHHHNGTTIPLHMWSRIATCSVWPRIWIAARHREFSPARSWWCGWRCGCVHTLLELLGSLTSWLCLLHSLRILPEWLHGVQCSFDKIVRLLYPSHSPANIL